jgi:CIC family chloride channel protein
MMPRALSVQGTWYRTGLRQALRVSDSGLLVLALVVGAGAAGFAIVFRWLIMSFTRLATGQADYAATPGASHPGLPMLGRWFLLGIPVLAGLLYGPCWCTSSPARRVDTVFRR